jgi:hypothetical protein
MAYDYDGARAAGVSDSDIVAHLSSKYNYNLEGARKAGVDDKDILTHLLSKSKDTSNTKLSSDNIPGNTYAPIAKQEDSSLVDKALGAGEAALSTITGLTGGAFGLAVGSVQGTIDSIAKGDFGTPEAHRRTEEKAAQTADALTYSPRTEKGKEYTEDAGKVLQEVMPVATLGHELGAVSSGLSHVKVSNPLKGSILKDVKAPKVVDPEFEASRIKPEESVTDVIARKNEATAQKQARLEELKLKQEGIPEEVKILEDGTQETTPAKEGLPLTETEQHEVATLETSLKPKPLARTDKEGSIHVDKEAATEDFHNGFSYIFDGEGPTGAQKKAVFEQLGITRDQFKEMIRTPEEYHTFLQAHEESHVRNGDHAKYPRTEEGKPDLMHEDAIAIEARATKDGIEAVQHPSSLAEGIEVIKKAQRDIRADIHNTDVFVGNLEHSLKELDPTEQINHRMTRALEEERTSDRLPENHPVKPLLEQVKERFKDIGERAKKAGLIDALRDNYVTHVLDFSKATISKEAQQALLDRIRNEPKDSKLVKDFAQERKFEFLRELEKQLEGTGVVVHTDIVKILHAYETAMQTAIAHKAMIDHFKTTLSPEGKAWILPLDAANIKAGYVPFQGKGARPLEGLVVHPDLKSAMQHVFELDNPNMVIRAMGAISHLTKAINTIGSFFHGYNLMTAHAMTAPLHALKEVFTAGSGIRQAVRVFERGGKDTTKIAGKDIPLEKLYGEFIRNGLIVGTEDVERTILATAGQSVDKILSKFAPVGKEVELVQKVTNPIDKLVLQKLNRVTWDYMHTGQKLNLATHLYANAKTKNPHIPDAILQKEVVSRINTAFGGLDWLEVASQVEGKMMQELAVAATGIRGRTYSQIALFAPDWTVSTIRSATDALPREMYKPKNWQLRQGMEGVYNPKTRGDFARRYMINTAIAYLTIINGINYAFSGHPSWENKDPARIDLGDGTSMQPAKHSMEPLEWVHNPMKTLGNKLGFIPKATYIQFSGRAYPGEEAPKIKPVYKGYGGMEVAKAKAILLSGSPFQVSAGVQAPEGEGVKRAVASALGIPIYGLTKPQMKKAIAKGKADKAKEHASK